MSVNDTLKAAAKFFELSEFPNGKALLLKAATTSNKNQNPTLRLHAWVPG
ncbi:hypothetical protein [Limnobacter sp. SAORIC-690]|nr:hypothetical protein [Limnobacter sp. SAORIC-690]